MLWKSGGDRAASQSTGVHSSPVLISIISGQIDAADHA